jgi:hypothetical protein
MIKRVSKMGYPITSHGIEKFQWMIEEQGKRDQDEHNMYIYNDFSGYGSTEMIENFVRSTSILFFSIADTKLKAFGFQQSTLQEGCFAIQEVGLRGGPCDLVQTWRSHVLDEYLLLPQSAEGQPC